MTWPGWSNLSLLFSQAAIAAAAAAHFTGSAAPAVLSRVEPASMEVEKLPLASAGFWMNP